MDNDNIKILAKLNVNHERLLEEKPFLFHKIIQAMDEARNEATLSATWGSGDSHLFAFCQN
jgi:hypothetical protein